MTIQIAEVQPGFLASSGLLACDGKKLLVSPSFLGFFQKPSNVSTLRQTHSTWTRGPWWIVFSHKVAPLSRDDAV